MHRRRYRAAPRAYLTTAAEESHQLNSGASLATILNDVVAIGVGRAFLNLHCLFANKATQKIDQRTFIVVQTGFFRRPSHFQPSPSPSDYARPAGGRLTSFSVAAL
jgi:hypothetical protein